MRFYKFIVCIIGSKWCSKFEVRGMNYRAEVVFEVDMWCSRFDVVIAFSVLSGSFD